MVSVVLIAQVTIFICYVGNIMAADPLRLKYGQLVFSTLVRIIILLSTNIFIAIRILVLDDIN